MQEDYTVPFEFLTDSLNCCERNRLDGAGGNAEGQVEGSCGSPTGQDGSSGQGVRSEGIEQGEWPCETL